MFNSDSGYSLADIAAATGKNDSSCDGFGGGAWWIIILFLFVFMGGGFGGYGNNGAAQVYQGTTTREEVAYGFDMNNIQDGIRSAQSGICDGFYAMNTGMLNGFAGDQNTMAQGFAGVNNSITTATSQLQQDLNAINIGNMQNTNAIQRDIYTNSVNNMQNTNALTAQLNAMAADQSACCCATQRLVDKDFSELNYNLASQECQTRQAISDNTRDIIESQCANTRSIIDFLTQDKIASLTAENQNLKFQASQQAQNAYLTEALGPKIPAAAYVVPNPFTGSYGYGNGCACNCG
jgi:hypothetical protein